MNCCGFQDMATHCSSMDAYQVGGYADYYYNNSDMATHHSLMDAFHVGGYGDYCNNSEMATQHPFMDHAYQVGGYVDYYFNNNADMATRHAFQDSGMWSHYPVSFSVEKESEPKYWDAGKCEVVGEGTTFEAAASDHDLELAMALSEQDPHMGDELTRRLSHFNTIPHVPRVNPDISPGDPWIDKQRLLDRIDRNGLAERQVDGDGNCQFRALSDQLYRTPDHHMHVRAQVVSQLSKAPDSYSSHVPMEYNQYLENMTRDGEWGDHVTLQAAADFYGVKISLITSFKDSCFTEILPAQKKSEKVLFLSFWSEFHYNSVYPLEDREKRKWLSSD